MQDEFPDAELLRKSTKLATDATVAEEDKWLIDMHQFLSIGLPPDKMNSDNSIPISIRIGSSYANRVSNPKFTDLGEGTPK